MNFAIELYAVIVTVLFVVFFVFYILHKKQIFTLSEKLHFLQKRTTHTTVTADFPSGDITQLVNSINELLEEYQQYIGELEKKESTVKETITNISHDLRTPLTAIRGYTQVLLHSDSLPSEEKEAVEIINERVNALNMLLDQLFEFARLEAGEFELSQDKVDLNVLLRSVVVSFYQAFEERGITPKLQISEEAFSFYGDEKAIVRVFTNIIYNALAHGDGGYVISSVCEDGKYIFTFQNSTKDIVPADIDKIFDRFYTTDKSRSKKSTGLGLAISRNLVTQMGGTIEARLDGNEFMIVICFS